MYFLVTLKRYIHALQNSSLTSQHNILLPQIAKFSSTTKNNLWYGDSYFTLSTHGHDPTLGDINMSENKHPLLSNLETIKQDRSKCHVLNCRKLQSKSYVFVTPANNDFKLGFILKNYILKIKYQRINLLDKSMEFIFKKEKKFNNSIFILL